MYLYRRSVKSILTAINYNLPEKAFELHTFSNQISKVSFKNLEILYNPQKPKVVH
jgi:hypothetical protein